MPRDPLIGIVGKPSSGKSTTLNSLTDAQAKTGSFPFTTIDPNKATGYLQIDCACSRFNKQEQCKPNYGWCKNGIRYVPILLLDVAGLVPGAHEGRGLGNKFLDDLRHADALIHVVDVSGTTDSEGKATRGYDPLNDIEWLQDEIFRWVQGNLLEKWGSIKRRHIATKSSTVDTLQNQFSGYGSTSDLVARALTKVGPFLEQERLKISGRTAEDAASSRGSSAKVNGGAAGSGGPPDGGLGPLEKWTDIEIAAVVKAFVSEKFPTVLALNKMDHPDADKNVSKIIKKHADSKIVLTSAISEVFLRKLAKQGYIKYEEGTEFLDTLDDDPDSGLKPLDDKLRERVESVRDLVLYRFGSTGVVQVLQAAAEILQLVPVYPVRNIHNFGGTHVFRDCVLVRRGTTVGATARKIMGDIPIAVIEGVGGTRIAEDDTIDVGKNDILSFRT